MSAQTPFLVFSGTNSRYLAEKICKSLGCPLGQMNIQHFADGEFAVSFEESIRGNDVFSVSYEESIRGKDVFLVQSTFPNSDNLMELLLMIDAAKRASAHSIIAVIPYFGWARQDRKDKPRVSIGAKLVADLLTAAGADNIIALDLHQDAIQGFLDIPVNHMTAMPIFVDYFKNKGWNPEELCVVSPDVGRAKAAKKFSSMLDCDIAIMHKDRPKHNQAEITALIGDVTDKICILNDDMIVRSRRHPAGPRCPRRLRLRHPWHLLRPGVRPHRELLHRGVHRHQRRARAA